MKFIFLKATLTGIVLSITCLVNVANAGVIIDTVNDSFIDTSTNLEWMDFGINNGQSYNYVASQLGVGGVYDGWSLGTKDQVNTLWTNMFLGLNASSTSPNQFGEGQFLVIDGRNKIGSVLQDYINTIGINLLDNLGTVDEVTQSFGLYEGTTGLSKVQVYTWTGSHSDLAYTDRAYILDNADYTTEYENINDETWSTMLVKTSSIHVTEPTTLVVFVLGLMGLGIRRLKTSIRMRARCL
ncbi:MAG: PEP-CTERM sorting domain-containing protein [Alteromonadaceae bacterium]|nr:PEP-CTERM sorting domain-containing protein [Alteromonadaceae bacterium]